MEEQEDKGIKEILKEMNDKLDEKKVKRKSFWMPLGSRVGKKRVKQGWATFLVVQDNRVVKFEKHPLDEQTTMVNGIPRIATPDEILIYKNKPFIILPSWSVKPFSPTDNYKETIEKQYASQGYKLLLNKMLNETIKVKNKISGWVVFAVIAGLIALGYFAWQGGLLK